MPYADPEQQKAAQRRYYDKNAEAYAERGRIYRTQMTTEVNRIKEASPCTDCGESYPACVMQFDHTGDDKVLAVSRLLRSKGWPTVLDEIAKCELVCANCHAVRSWRRSKGLPLT